METFFQKLKRHIQGEIRYDSLIRKIYSVDASIYEVEPLGVVCPKSEEELLYTLQLAAEYDLPIIPRGAATGITGGCLGNGVIIDTSLYLNKILEINYDEEFAVCEPGVVQDRLNDALAAQGYRLGPDTSTGNRATLGGMLANNAAGARSLFYGRMVDHVLDVDVALAGGALLKCRALNEAEVKEKSLQNNVEGNIYREVQRILSTHAEAIKKHFPQIPRHVSGYNLDALLKDTSSLNLSKLIVGSEGSLGIATKIKVRIAKRPRHTGLCIIHVSDMIRALHAIPQMLLHSPLSLEMIDHKILEMGKKSPAMHSKLKWLQGEPEAVFVAEMEGESDSEVKEKLDNFIQAIRRLEIGYAFVVIQDPKELSHVWDVRKAGLGLLLSKRSYSRAIAFIEDISVAPHMLPSFMQNFCDYLKNIGKEAGIYGHIGSGCMHIRPYIDLRSEDEVALMQSIMLDVSKMLLNHGGALSGEHGDGLIRSWLNKRMFGEEIYQAFIEIKSAFDPHNLMNPGKIVHGPDVKKNLRINYEIPLAEIPTFLNFEEEGGIELAADLCNGNGQCRKMENVMCPSFQATQNEYDTTRARAQSLRSIIHKRLPFDELTSKALQDVLELCIECKGCKRECPSQVDMAKMKSELLYQYQEKHGYSFRNKLFGHIHVLNRYASSFASLFNLASKFPLSKWWLNHVGITTKRPLPKIATERFSKWFYQQPQTEGKEVILFNDTYTEFNYPEIGKAAFEVFRKLGYKVTLANNLCCGRPLISKGMLKEAKSLARNTIEALYKLINNETPIVSLEPSCLSALIDDFKGLVDQDDKDLQFKLKNLTPNCCSLDTFLSRHLKHEPISFVSKGPVKILFHGHCHQKALETTQAMQDVLKIIPDAEVKEIESGCCGVAGSFGYEKEHYEMSMKIGELKLLPAVRKAPAETLIVANGVSCRSQIQHGASRRALHLAELVSRFLS